MQDKKVTREITELEFQEFLENPDHKVQNAKPQLSANHILPSFQKISHCEDPIKKMVLCHCRLLTSTFSKPYQDQLASLASVRMVRTGPEETPVYQEPQGPLDPEDLRASLDFVILQTALGLNLFTWVAGRSPSTSRVHEQKLRNLHHSHHQVHLRQTWRDFRWRADGERNKRDSCIETYGCSSWWWIRFTWFIVVPCT